MVEEGLVIFCSNDLSIGLAPHNVSGYLAKVLGRLSTTWSRKVKVKGPLGGINMALRGVDLERLNLVLLDDRHLTLGKVKVRLSKSYRRGHNALKMLGDRLYKSNFQVIMVGVECHYDDVNVPFRRLTARNLNCFLIGIARALILAWPNVSMFVQLSNDFHRKATMYHLS